MEVLDEQFEDDPDVFVGANMFLYYRKGDPTAVVAPDGFVVKGVPKLPGGVHRRRYLLWNEGEGPCFVLETTSKSTHLQDRNKRKIYAQLGVDEYFQFDPFGEYLSPPLQGFRLVNRRYKPLKPDPDGSLLSQTTGVIFRPDGIRLRLKDAATAVGRIARGKGRAPHVAGRMRHAKGRAPSTATETPYDHLVVAAIEGGSPNISLPITGLAS